VPWTDGDLGLLRRLLGEPETTAHLGGPQTAEQILARHQRYLRLADPGTGRPFKVVAGPDSRAAGWVGYWDSEHDGATEYEIGWSVLPEFQGRGVGTRATALAIALAREEGRHRWLHAMTRVTNDASNALCRRLGFERVATVDLEFPPGQFAPNHHWRLDLRAP
jgi:RimJ/RimL family protein N-acetyltransferase